ncbi:hypothetical protein B0T25DRAFT_581891 [Lasiosphaeria hispida]|uniref:Uncharacterized protein n=1 Tax=Lasiosphaeria hispida TaxID=260671 RepID=A0AAJ0HDH3_9PEZI|nr:hypothetical protein B0T25DRAFT_581891 [Lasiosphaeria hispida]
MSIDPKSWYHLNPARAGSDACLAAILGLDNSDPFPVRTVNCSSPTEEVRWQFVPDDSGRYFIYNKAWGSDSVRLDCIFQDSSSLNIPWMGPLNDTFTNQRWILTPTSTTFQITNLGFPGLLLSTTDIDGSFGARLQNASDAELADTNGAAFNVRAISTAATVTTLPQSTKRVTKTVDSSPSSTPPATTTTPPPPPPPFATGTEIPSTGPGAPSSGMDLGSKVALAVAGVATVAALSALVIWFLVIKRRNRDARAVAKGKTGEKAGLDGRADGSRVELVMDEMPAGRGVGIAR